MPFVEVKMTKGRTKLQKEELMREISYAVARIAKCPLDVVSVVIDDRYDLDEWSVGGKTWEEKLKS